MYTDIQSHSYRYRVLFTRTSRSDGAVQVDCIKTRVEWIHRVQLQYDELLSNFGIKFNLRRCSKRSWG